MNRILSNLTIGLVAGAMCAATNSARACGEDFFSALAQDAVSEDASKSSAAIDRLRAEGPAGLDALFETHADTLKLPHSDPKWQRLSAALDAVGKQRDCYASHLYWYTDFEIAKAAAKATGKPILSLRLLGNLDEEFSCANSRFFRTALYANTEVSQYLREHFVLHWKSVRPVPKVTVDFGDGRMLERTIAGNSIHYVLDADGHPVDALPGLYGPKAFVRVLAEAEKQARRGTGLAEFHTAQLKREFSQVAEDARLDAGSRELMRTKLPDARTAGRLSISKAAVEDPMLRVITTFERTLAEDTRQNETVLHRQIHEWFIKDTVPANVDAFNERVYAELFLTPSSDPWLGLMQPDYYTALEGNGIIAAGNKP